MPSSTLRLMGSDGFVLEDHTRYWNHSPRVGLKRDLQLRNNLLTWIGSEYTTLRYPHAMRNVFPKAPPSASNPGNAVLKLYSLAALEARCYSKIRGKLYKGSASLGVTLASMKQSREMIAGRYAFLTSRASAVAHSIIQMERRRGKMSTKDLERMAGFHLEVIFGWIPLLVDIHAATTSVIQLADVHEWVSTNARAYGEHTESGGTSPNTYSSHYATASKMSYSVGVRVKNPNVWLAERAGLLNPATVAWDVVPWSFVVNMFVNTGQLVQQITDFAGLGFSDVYRTTTMGYRATSSRTSAQGAAFAAFRAIDKRREQAPMPKPPGLTFRLPEVNWEIAAMAASLFIQQFSRISTPMAEFLRRRART